ncbi:MAG: ATP-binding protein [Herbaspirillum sp.]
MTSPLQLVPGTSAPADEHLDHAAQLAARDKTIAALKRRLIQEAQRDHDSPFALLAQNVALEQVVARKTAELEAERQELRHALVELNVTQAQLLQAQKMESIGQLAAGVAHEINTPTQYVADNIGFIKSASGVIMGILDKALDVAAAARHGAVPPALLEALDAQLSRSKLAYLQRQIPEALDQSQEGMHHIARIVTAMKDFSHPFTGEVEQVDIRDVITTTVTLARNEWKYVADLETRLAHDLPVVPCMRDLLSQALLNLVVNAAHAVGDALQRNGKEKGLITVSADTVGTWLEIRVSDNGCGIPERIRGRIFDPFFTTKPVGKGTGQGLAIAYAAIVDKHRGEIRCESEEGLGTTFVVRLPLTQPQGGTL